MTSRLAGLASLFSAFAVAALVNGTTQVIDDTNSQPILISNHEAR